MTALWLILGPLLRRYRTPLLLLLGVVALLVALWASVQHYNAGLIEQGRREAERAQAAATIARLEGDKQRLVQSIALLGRQARVLVDTLRADSADYADAKSQLAQHPDVGDTAAARRAIEQRDAVIAKGERRFATCSLLEANCEQRVAAEHAARLFAEQQRDVALRAPPGPAPSPSPSLLRRAATSLLWMSAGYAAGRLLPHQ